MVADAATIESAVKKIAEAMGLSLVLLFGSQATGKTHRESDVDIAYLSDKSLDLMTEARLMVDLMPIFESSAVDVVDLKKAPPLLMKLIFDHHKVLFCRDYGKYFAYLMYAKRRYREAASLFAMRDKALSRFLKTHAR